MRAPSSEIRDCLSYDPNTGLFTWLVKRGRANVGSVAGYVQSNGDGSHVYIAVRFNGKEYAAHRLAWWWMTGVWSEHHIDHKDTDSRNNRWDNLREATYAQNMANRKRMRTSTTGYKGVYRSGDKYASRIQSGGVRVFLGNHDTPEAAYAAYVAASQKIHGEFSRVL